MRLRRDEGWTGLGLSHRSDKAGDDPLEDGVFWRNHFTRGRWEKAGRGKVAVTGEDGLAMMENQRDVALFERAELEKHAVVFMKAQLPPLFGIHPMEKRPAGMVWNILQNRQ